MNTETYWKIPSDLISLSVQVMRPHGAKGNEGLALWFGKEAAGCIDVTHIVEAYGPGFVTGPLHMTLSLRAMATLTDLSERLDRFLVGQIHSHPGTMIDLSPVDIRLGIRIPNYLSVVCPYYAQKPIFTMAECGVHVFEKNSYRRLKEREIDLRLKPTSTQTTLVKCEVRQ